MAGTNVLSTEHRRYQQNSSPQTAMTRLSGNLTGTTWHVTHFELTLFIVGFPFLVFDLSTNAWFRTQQFNVTPLSGFMVGLSSSTTKGRDGGTHAQEEKTLCSHILFDFHSHPITKPRLHQCHPPPDSDIPSETP